MPSQGYLQVHAFTSNAEIPLQDVAIAITDTQNNPIAFRLTNRSGILNEPVGIEVPDISESQNPGSPEAPYTVLNLTARKENYELIQISDLQVFSGITTKQNLSMIPLAEFPESWNQSESFETYPQAL